MALSDQADFAEKNSGINSMTFSEASSREATGSARDAMRLVTGGEDGVLRVWEVGAAKRESRSFCHLLFNIFESLGRYSVTRAVFFCHQRP